jgi:N-acetylmuramoyl-L-alanine amidase
VRVPSEVGPLFELRTSHGVLSLEIGSRAAWWNGSEYWLGFAPRLTNGEPLLFGVDLLKNVVPLVSGAASPGFTNRVLVIDPGHGGSNTGATSIVNQRAEKELTLDWARRLQRLLATNGWTVHLTRTTDADVPLAERVSLAERVKADLFVSLHFNSAFPKTDQAGIETYCLTPAGLPSSLVRDFTDDSKSVFPNNAFDAQNLHLALRLHGAVVRGAGGTDRGVRRARFMDVLRGQNRPAVLLEGGYLSNPKEARLLASADHRQKLAEAVAKGLSEFVGSSTSAMAEVLPAGARAIPSGPAGRATNSPSVSGGGGFARPTSNGR